MRFGMGLELVVDSLFEQAEISIHSFETAHLEAEQETVVFFHLPFQRASEIRDLVAETPLREFGHLLGGGFTLENRPQHTHPGNAENIAGDAGELDVRGLQELEEAVALGRPALDDLASIPQEVAKLTDWLRRDEALGDQAVPEQIRDPLTILDVGFAPGHVLDVVCFAYDELELV